MNRVAVGARIPRGLRCKRKCQTANVDGPNQIDSRWRLERDNHVEALDALSEPRDRCSIRLSCGISGYKDW